MHALLKFQANLNFHFVRIKLAFLTKPFSAFRPMLLCSSQPKSK